MNLVASGVVTVVIFSAPPTSTTSYMPAIMVASPNLSAAPLDAQAASTRIPGWGRRPVHVTAAAPWCPWFSKPSLMVPMNAA